MRLSLILAAILPIVVCPLFAGAYVLPKLLVLSISVAIGMIFSIKSPGRAGSLDIPIGLCLGVLTISALFSQDRILSLFGMYNYYANGLCVSFLLAGVYWISNRATQDDRRFALRVALGTGAVVGLVGLLESFGFRIPGIGPKNLLSGGRAVSLLGSPISLGGICAMCAVLALGEPTRWRWLALIGALMGLYSSGSRSAWLACAGGWGVYLCMAGLPASKWGKIALLLATMMVGGSFYHRLTDRRTEAKEVDLARVEVWRIAWRSFKDHPFLGGGPDTFEIDFRRNKTEDYIKFTKPIEYQAHAHNDVLQVMTTTGLLGLASYLILLAVTCMQVSSKSAASLSALFALFVAAKFNPVPMECLALAAILIGGLGSRNSRAAMGWRSAGKGLSLLVFLFVTNLANADLAAKKGRLMRSVYLNPQDPGYAIAYINWSLEHGQFQDALKQGRVISGWHPAYSIARFCHGSAALELARHGEREYLDEAIRECDAAMKLDPLFTPILLRRAMVAAVKGDIETGNSILRRYAYLNSLSHREAKTH